MKRLSAWLCLVVLGCGAVWANSFISRKDAQKSLGKLISIAQTHIDKPKELAIDLEEYLVNVKDRQEVRLLYQMILEKSQNPVSVALALKNYPSVKSRSQKTALLLEKKKSIEKLLLHQSPWVQLLVIRELVGLRARSKAVPVLLTLATSPNWEVRLERDAAAFRAAGEQTTVEFGNTYYKAAWASGVLSELLDVKTPESQAVLKLAIKDGRLTTVIDQAIKMLVTSDYSDIRRRCLSLQEQLKPFLQELEQERK